MAKSGFFGKKEFKLFLTVWIIYIFYLQMFGSSCMANSQSALTAAIVNEGRFEVDTYHRVSCDLAFYNEHYYSGQAPGISFLSVPLYIASKPVFYILPQSIINHLFENLENYGGELPVDYWGNKKVLSNYFEGLNKRQVLEYILISGFILPIFTTALFSAIGAVLVYSMLRRFTKNEGLRMATTAFYAFGTILFPLSTEFFEREIAIVLMFSAFFILFKIRHKEIKPTGSALFTAGVFAGISAWFDYFHLFASGLLFIYLVSFFIRSKPSKLGFKRLRIFDLNKQRASLLLKFIIGVSIPVLLLFSYFYIIFDDPFATSYTHRIVSASNHSILDVFNAKFPSAGTLFHMLKFILFSPIVIFALYGLYRALLKKDKYYHDAFAVAIFVVFTLLYASALAFTYPDSVAPSFKRHMTPILPYTFVFLPYIFANSIPNGNKIKIIFLSLGVISIFFNWVSAQFGGHHGLSHFDLETKKFDVIPQFLENGPSSDFLSTLAGTFNGNALLFNIIGLVILSLIILLIWRVYLAKK